LGTSNWQNISYNIELVRKLNPASILDVGVGFGRWGILFREFLEIWENSGYDGKWERTIDGIEIFPGYIKDYHKYFYNNIFMGDALDILERTDKQYDLINFGDVIEHFDKTSGEKLIETAMDKSKYVLINIPIGKHWAQSGTKENPNEAHKSIWYNNDFTKFKYYKIKSFCDNTLRNFSVVLLSKNKIKFDKRFGKYFTVKNILKHKLGLKRIIESYENRKR
jgi:hypothetical protein